MATSPALKLAIAKQELEAHRQNYPDYRSQIWEHSDWWKARKAWEKEERKRKAKISRYESAVLKAKGPIIHHDVFQQPFLPGAAVLWSHKGSFAGWGARIWYVSYCTPKKVVLTLDPQQVGQPGTSTGPEYLLVIDKLLPQTPQATP